MDKQDIESVKKLARFETVDKHPQGGQHCGIMPKSVRLICEEFEFDLTISRYRGQKENRDLAITLFELYLSTFP